MRKTRYIRDVMLVYTQIDGAAGHIGRSRGISDLQRGVSGSYEQW